jgi:hypothetical protein
MTKGGLELQMNDYTKNERMSSASRNCTKTGWRKEREESIVGIQASEGVLCTSPWR